MQQNLVGARAFTRTMSDRELVDETSTLLDDPSHFGWQAIHEAVSRGGLRVRPWPILVKELKGQARQGGADAVIDVRYSYGSA
jgi:hypothetical protein